MISSARFAHGGRGRERQILVTVRLEGVLRVSGVGYPPVEGVHVEPRADERFDEAVAGPEVEDVWLADQAHHEEKGRRERSLVTVIAVEPRLVATPHHVLGTDADFGPPDAGDVLQPVARAQRGAIDVTPDPCQHGHGTDERRH